jgi:hypothetical protein
MASRRARLVTAVSGTLVYVADLRSGLQVIDISNPQNPQIVGSVDTPGIASDLTVSDTFAWVADWSSGLQVIDITNPANLHRIGGYQSFGYVNDVTVSGHYAFLAEGARFDGTNSFGGGLVVVDITDPLHPEEIGRYGGCLFMSSVAGMRSVTVAGSYAYVTDDAGLHVIDISNPTNPRRVGGNPVLGSGWTSVLTDGEHLFSAGDSGLVIFDLFRLFRLEPLTRNAANELRLKVDGPRGVSASIQRSTNLIEWEDWRSSTLGATPTEISDPDAATALHHFYRGVIR